MTPDAPSAARLLAQVRAAIDVVDAEHLLLHVLARPRSWLFAHADDPVADADAERFLRLCRQRRDGQPVAYLTGTQGFWSLDLAVTPATLIPRPETERLVELALERLPAGAGAHVADLGTGSGAIALAIARERPQAQVIASDASAAALEVARANAERNRIRNVQFRQGDWLVPLAGERFDLIASNPPYIADGDPHLSAGDLRFEPPTALSSGADGLDAIRVIVRDARAMLQPGGWLLLEHGWDQGDAVRALLQGGGYGDVATEQDLEARDRISLGRMR